MKDLKKLHGDNIAAQVMARAEEGLPKMWVAHHALRLRRERPEWFGAEAAYTPLLAEGPKNDHVIAYLRGDSLAVVVPRLTVKLGGAWREARITLPRGRWLNVLTNGEIDGGRVAVKSLLNSFPVALLVRRDDNKEQSNA
jgi:(1->4)-alpha-D-glucan 1-alpha-D-glucosylmutase